MKEERITISTTHVDRHGDRITLRAFRGLVDGSPGLYFPVGVEHDPRIAPVGRLKKLEIVELDDGEFALVGTSDLFEPGDDLAYDPRGKLLPKPRIEDEGAFLGYDRNLRDAESQRILADIGSLIGAKPEEEVKKALDPITVLTIGFAFVIGQVASGFFTRLGEDGYNALKGALKKLLKIRDNEKQDRLLRFQALVQSGEEVVEVNVILTNPSAEDIDLWFSRGMRVLDEHVQRAFEAQEPLHSITYEYSEGELRLSFAVRKDGVPMFPKERKDGDS